MRTIALCYPLPEAWLPKLWSWLHEAPTANFDDGAPKDYDGFAAYMRQRLDQELVYGITADGEPVGACGARALGNGRGQWRGLCVAKAFWRRRVATEAVRLLYRDLVARGIASMDVYVFADNVPIQRLFEQQFNATRTACGLETIRNGERLQVTHLSMRTGGC